MSGRYISVRQHPKSEHWAPCLIQRRRDMTERLLTFIVAKHKPRFFVKADTYFLYLTGAMKVLSTVVVLLVSGIGCVSAAAWVSTYSNVSSVAFRFRVVYVYL